MPADPLRSDNIVFMRPSMPDHAAPPPLPRRSGNPLLLPLAFIAVNVAVWLLGLFRGVNWYAPSTADLEAWGGNIALLTLTGEPWRLLTSLFLHGGVLHLFVNMYFLFQIGPLLVQRKGNMGFAIVYLGGGLLASAASAWWQVRTMFGGGLTPAAGTLPPLRLIVSVGASGAIMAVAGALAGSLVLSHYRAQAGMRDGAANRQLMQALLRVIGINVALGFFIPGLDQAAHIGGLLAGAVLGIILPLRTGVVSRAASWGYTLAAAGLSIVLVLGFLAASNTPQLQRVKAQLLRHEAARQAPGNALP